MGRSQETFHKKEVRNRKEKKKKDKANKRIAKKGTEKKQGLDAMIAYVDEFGRITDTPPDPDSKQEVELEDIEISVSKSDDSQKFDPVRQGIVAFFNDSKGYGFIRDIETRESVFVHINNVVDGELKENNKVSFEIGKGPKGPTALNVKLVK